MALEIRRFVIVVLLALAWIAPAAAGQPKGKAYDFKGTVEAVDAKGKTVTVDGEDVPGWMPAMSMTYLVDKPDVLTGLKAGTQIVARVYEGDLKTLYDVRVAPAKK